MFAVRGSIILCWLMLIACLIIKLIGGDWFGIMCDNEHFVYICNYIDAHLILQDIIAVLQYVIVGYFIFKAMARIEKPNKAQRFYIIIVLVGIWTTHLFGATIKFIVETSFFIVSPIVINLLSKDTRRNAFMKNWYRGAVGCILVVLFQFISLFVRNIGIKITDYSYLVTIILSIDYYIMVALYYLSIKLKIEKEKSNG